MPLFVVEEHLRNAEVKV